MWLGILELEMEISNGGIKRQDRDEQEWHVANLRQIAKSPLRQSPERSHRVCPVQLYRAGHPDQA